MTTDYIAFKDSDQYESAKSRIKTLMKKLTEKGFEVVANKADCNSCSLALMKGQGKNVYYHYQAWDSFKRNGCLLLGYGAGKDATDEQDVDAGRIIANTAGEMDIPVLWNGTGMEKIGLVFYLYEGETA